jgi:hypothetical protein
MDNMHICVFLNGAKSYLRFARGFIESAPMSVIIGNRRCLFGNA